jgi:diguanylate cyclase (GGDEF)-like protein
MQVAELIRSKVKSRAIVHEGSGVSKFVTLSFGVAGVIPPPKTTPERLIAEADQALYKAKVEGRDRVVGNLVEV